MWLVQPLGHKSGGVSQGRAWDPGTNRTRPGGGVWSTQKLSNQGQSFINRAKHSSETSFQASWGVQTLRHRPLAARPCFRLDLYPKINPTLSHEGSRGFSLASSCRKEPHILPAAFLAPRPIQEGCSGPVESLGPRTFLSPKPGSGVCTTSEINAETAAKCQAGVEEGQEHVGGGSQEPASLPGRPGHRHRAPSEQGTNALAPSTLHGFYCVMALGSHYKGSGWGKDGAGI